MCAARTHGLGAGGIVRPGRGEPQPSGVKSSGWACTDGVSLSAHRLTVPEAITRIRTCGNSYTVLEHLEPRLAKTRPCRRVPIGLLLLPAWAATIADVWMADRHNITGQPDDEILHELVLVVLEQCTCDVMVPQGSSASR